MVLCSRPLPTSSQRLSTFLHVSPLPAPPQVHLILRHKSPKTGKIEEKHLQAPPFVESDSKTHVYTAVLRASNNSYTVLVDGEEKKAGSLFEDFDPSINPPETIPDPEDKKPADWVDEARWVLRRAPLVWGRLGNAHCVCAGCLVSAPQQRASWQRWQGEWLPA